MANRGGHIFTLAISTIVLSACVTPKLPEPTLSNLQPKTSYFVDAIEVVVDDKVKSATIKSHIENVLRNLPRSKAPAGDPLVLKVTITEVHDVSPVESLMIGGINSINEKFSLVHKEKKEKLYEIPLDARSANYAPGGILGLIAEASSDDEPKLARVLVEKMRQWVLIEHDMQIATNLSVGVTKIKGVAPINVETPVIATAPIEREYKPEPPKRLTLGSGETICDIAGKWESQYYHARGYYEDVVTIEQSGRQYTMIKSVGNPWLEAGSIWFKGRLNSAGFEIVEANFSSGWTTVPAKINERCDTINLSTINGSIDFFKLKRPRTASNVN